MEQGGGNPAMMARAATGAARLMMKEDGPRIGVSSYDGWDTHANQGGATGRLADLLDGLDRAFAAFEREFGAAGKDTVVLVVTEFGRTANINGTEVRPRHRHRCDDDRWRGEGRARGRRLAGAEKGRSS